MATYLTRFRLAWKLRTETPDGAIIEWHLFREKFLSKAEAETFSGIEAMDFQSFGDETTIEEIAVFEDLIECFERIVRDNPQQ